MDVTTRQGGARMNAIWQTLLALRSHPLSGRAPARALARFARWQLGSRLLAGDVIVPFVEGSRLVMRRGMTGATGNLYTGLHEFEDMGFLLHVLRAGDLFLDIGANVGSYTVLASAVCRARTIAVEPVPATLAALRQNVAVNEIGDLVEVLNVALGPSEDAIQFTSELDTVNHVLAPGETGIGATIEVPVKRLDGVLADRRSPVLCKIDVEGFEAAVLEGAPATLADPALIAVIMELNGSSERYGRRDEDCAATMRAAGFAAYSYDPFTRSLTPLPTIKTVGNTLFVRDRAAVIARVQAARSYTINGVSF